MGTSLHVYKIILSILYYFNYFNIITCQFEMTKLNILQFKFKSEFRLEVPAHSACLFPVLLLPVIKLIN